eukprot:jgi/Botrbrau1/16473/Bobra.0142s0067.1
MLAVLRRIYISSLRTPGRSIGRTVYMPKTRRDPPHAVILASAFQERAISADGQYVDVKVDVEDAFIAVNGFTKEDEEAFSPDNRSKRRRRSGKKPESKAPLEAKVKNSEEWRVGRMSPVDLGPPPGKMYVGAHVSMASGMERAVVNAAAIGARAFALDTRSKRRWDCPPLTHEGAQAFRDACVKFGYSIDHIMPHGSYLINLASPDEVVASKSTQAFLDELQRCEMLGIKLYNIHPGTTCGQMADEEGLALIARHINAAHRATKDVVVVLENTAGGGSTLGRTFQQLRGIIDAVSDKTRVGVCLDTCHLFAAGYDIASSRDAYESVMKEFDEVIGFHYLRAMHLNDSKAPLGSRKDRHENIGRGCIGQSCFEWILNDSRFQGLPLIMETPVQEKPPNIDYKKSLMEGRVYFKQGENFAQVGTDERDIKLLYSFVSEN